MSLRSTSNWNVNFRLSLVSKASGLALYSPLGDDNWGEQVYVEGRPAS